MSPEKQPFELKALNVQRRRRHRNLLSDGLISTVIILCIVNLLLLQQQQHPSQHLILASKIQSDQNFTFTHNGSYLQLDAGRDWPFNSKREISFRFRTRNHHGLLLYQTFDHSKLAKEDDQEGADSLMPPKTPHAEPKSQFNPPSHLLQKSEPKLAPLMIEGRLSRVARSPDSNEITIKQLVRPGHRDKLQMSDSTIDRLASNAITATASERLVNSLFLASPAAPINGNTSPVKPASVLSKVISGEISGGSGSIAGKGQMLANRNQRILQSNLNSDPQDSRFSHAPRSSSDKFNDRSAILSSSTINSLSASLYELYLKLENGRLKIMYEYGSRLNQTYCGKGLNDDRWHRVDLRVDPELNQMVLILDGTITMEIVLNQQQQNQQQQLQLQDDDSSRRNELVFTNSILYLGGLDSEALAMKGIKQRLYMAQFIGCIGQIVMKTDLHSEASLQPVNVEKMALVRLGCINKCDTENYCLHHANCINYYTHTKCDCFGTRYEDVYCWQDKLTTLTMLGHSSLVFRIYDWRDRYHTSTNRLSIQFKTFASDAILFFAYGDFGSSQQILRSSQLHFSPLAYQNQLSTTYGGAAANQQLNLSSPLLVQKPISHQIPAGTNYLAVSLTNGSLVVEISFGDQPLVLSNSLYEKLAKIERGSSSEQSASNLADGRWHNVTLFHNIRHIALYLDEHSSSQTLQGKNFHLYFDPSVYIGSVPQTLYNETRMLARPFSQRHKFVGCLRSIYFNQHNILLALSQKLPMAEYKDISNETMLNSCSLQEPNSLPLTLRSGRSYLTFQISANQGQPSALTLRPESSTVMSNPLDPTQLKDTKIQFDYKTSMSSYFLAGGHLRDLNYHDLGGFWTLHAARNCVLVFTLSSGLGSEPDQVVDVHSPNSTCPTGSWFRVSLTMVTGEKTLNISHAKLSTDSSQIIDETIKTYTLRSYVELLHQVQIGGNLAKFDESLTLPFSGCIRRIRINNRSFDARDFVTTNSMPGLINQGQNSSQSGSILNRLAQGLVTLDSCQQVNACQSMNPCKNNGICRLNEMGEPECDCSKTGYSGKRCHFSNYKSSCLDLYLSGQRRSSFYLIDLDRNGPLGPIRVRCNMDEDDHIETSLFHNLPPEYLIRRSTGRDVTLDITYMAFHHDYTSDGFYIHNDTDILARKQQEKMLQNLIGQSSACKQYIRYECRSAPLLLGNKTWMEAPFPVNHRVASFNGRNEAKCECALSSKRCLNPEESCNCDSGESIWSDDAHLLTSHDNVAITKIVLLQQDPRRDESNQVDPISPSSKLLESQSRITLGELKCYKSKYLEREQEITFKTSDAYIETPGWRRGDISFSFRTASLPPVIILYQLATSRNHGYFRLTLISDHRLLFEFIVNRKPRKAYVNSAHKLNNGEWQQVYIEYDAVNLKLSVNDDSIMIDLDVNDNLGTFEGPLFIGGAPSKYLVGDASKRSGFTGCFRGLTIDGRSVDLGTYLSPLMPTVTSGCKPSCTKNLCQNNGKCVEYWGSYECECSNPIAHSGINCEINLNTNSITFVTQEAYYVQVLEDTPIHPLYLIKNILLNIRTYQETALILYGFDRSNNFVQLHKNGSNLVLTFNSYSTIITTQVPIDEQDSESETRIQDRTLATSLEPAGLQLNASNSNMSLAISNSTRPLALNQVVQLIEKSVVKSSNMSGKGQPIQVKIERHRMRTTFYVNNNFVVIEKPLMLLSNYSQNPWTNPDSETVRPIRPKLGARTHSKLFLANVDEHFASNLPGFTGCVQGLSIDNQLFDFNRAHLTGEFRGEFRIGCKMHCDSYPCKNQGTCIENWKEDKIQCRCDSTSYVGRNCDEDVAANFDGQTSYLIYNVAKKLKKQSPLLLDTNAPSNRTDAEGYVNFFEISLAFSTDINNQQVRANKTSIQVIVYMTRSNSAQHFLLALTSDGSLLVQEDYGNTMSLSKIIKRPEHSFNDGHRHMIKYSRYNQTIQIVVDFQSYLPSMSVIPASNLTQYSKDSVILIGSSSGMPKRSITNGSEYINYSGCISNLVVKVDGSILEPFSEAFGQDIELIKQPSGQTQEFRLDENLTADVEIGERNLATKWTARANSESLDNSGIIEASSVEQGKCAPFKKSESFNEKRSINEPKNNPSLEPRPVYMDAPRLKPFVDLGAKTINRNGGFVSKSVFYSSLIFLSVVSLSMMTYAYILQARYRSEKFRYETPFFHKRSRDRKKASTSRV